MIRHAVLFMGVLTFLFGAGTWWARATNPDLVTPWLIVTALAAAATVALVFVTTGSSDE